MLTVNEAGRHISGQISIGNFYKVLFLCFVVMGLYYPSIFSDFNSIDDSHIISYLEDTDFSLLDVILPGRSHYYRPVVWLSLFFDKYVWGLQPSFMHLENILIHLLNALLVYLIAGRLAGADEQRLELPLLTALLFAAHPINTEAVCWVAGRTDPLATVFILLSAYMLVRRRPVANCQGFYLPAVMIFLGCMAKEVAFFFFPIAAITALLQYYPSLVEEGLPAKLKGCCRVALPFLFFALLYLYLRQSALPGEDRSVSILLVQKTSYLDAVIAGFKAFGFYIKKLFLPLPLNFAIVSYNHAYLWVGLVFTPLLCWLLWQRKFYYQYLGTSFFLIFPAVIVAVKPIAWTPVAERYLYAPGAFFVIAMVGILYILAKNFHFIGLLLPLLICTVILASLFTVRRNLVWQDNYLLYKDAVAKSPTFARIRNELGIAVAGKGDMTEARNQFQAGSEFDGSYTLPVLNLANIKFKNGDNAGALKILDNASRDKKDAKVDILKLRARIYESMFFSEHTGAEKKEIVSELLATYDILYFKSKEPYVAYRYGQILLAAGKHRQAGIMFELAANAAPKDAFYSQAAKKLAEKYKAK